MTTQHAMLRGALALGLFALVTAGSVALTRAVTAERIAEHQLAYQHRQLQEVLPASLASVPLQAVLESAFSLPNPLPLGHRTPQEGWRVQQGSEAATILPVNTPRV